MRLEQLEYFIRVADKQSLSYAAEELFISQQALSTSIKNLETEFKTKLFIRTPRGMSLSEDGKYFYEKAVKILALSHELYEHFVSDERPEAGNLIVATNKRNKNHFLSKVTSLFYKNYPQYNVTYNIMNRNKVKDAVLSGQADIGVQSLLKVNKKFVMTLTDELIFIPFHVSEYNLLTYKDSPLSGFNSISMETIVKYPIILMAESDLISDLFYEMVNLYNSQAEIIWADSVELQEQMVEDGLGNMFIGKTNPIPSKTGRIIPITNSISVESGFLLLAEAVDNPLRDLFIKESKRTISQEKNL